LTYLTFSFALYTTPVFGGCFDTDSTLYTLLISYVNSSFMLGIDTSP